MWVDKGSEFYSSSFKKWLKDNDIEMYSTHNEGKSVVAERFIRTLKNKIYKHTTSVSKKCLLINWMIQQMNAKIHIRAIKVKPIEVKDNTYIDSIKEVIIKILNVKLVIMLEYQNTKTFLLKDILQISLKKLL